MPQAASALPGSRPRATVTPRLSGRTAAGPGEPEGPTAAGPGHRRPGRPSTVGGLPGSDSWSARPGPGGSDGAVCPGPDCYAGGVGGRSVGGRLADSESDASRRRPAPGGPTVKVT
jgi:hypothetical protein